MDLGLYNIRLDHIQILLDIYGTGYPGPIIQYKEVQSSLDPRPLDSKNPISTFGHTFQID
jgi:hypothetical protein